MEKEKPYSTTNSQRSSSTRENPPSPQPSELRKENKRSEERSSSSQREYSEPMQRLLGFEDRKSTFYKTLEEALAIDYTRIRHDVENDRVPDHLPKYPAKDGETPTVDEKTAYYCNLLKNECYEYIEPLHEGVGLSIAAAIETHTAFAHLNKLHDLLDKICDMLDQNYKMQVYMQDLKTLTELKNIEKKDLSEYEDLELSDPDSDLETNISLLTSILEASKSTSTVKGSTKHSITRERSKSVFADAGNQLIDKDPKPPPLRRQSAFTEGKAKVSKWTKVKAAFKWEKANVPALNEGKSSDSGIGLIPVNHEVARYLRVPSVPCGGSSADSVFSSSSGHLLSETGTPGTISSASSVDDIERASQSIRRDSSKSDSKCDSRLTLQDENHRSHSIDGDLGSLYNRQELKDSSPIQIKQQRDQIDSSEYKNSPATSQGSLDRISDSVKKPTKSSSLKGMRKSKIVSDFEALPEDVIVDITSKPKRTKHLPSPLNLNLRHDLSEVDYPDVYANSPNLTARSPWEKTKNRKFQSPGNSSVPSSPSRHSEFFPEFESEELSSGDFSEPTTPHSKLFSSNSLHMQQEEINQRYSALRERLKMEFEAKRQEWDKIRNMYSTKTTAYHFLGKDDPPQQQAKSVSTKLLEENLTPDFKKKLHKWRVKKQISLHGHGMPKEAQTSPTKDTDSKKIDWNLWRTGQIKLEGQGLSPLPDQKNLPEEFQKKLEQWNKIKTSGLANTGHDLMKRSSKPDPLKKLHDDDKHRSEKPRSHEREKLEKLSKLKAIVADPRIKEIEVKTTAGVMKFEGISRKFTRKLYEWEKARGIGPESSTFALLHPGYCPLDVGKIPKEGNKNENSPTLSRSLSLDSVAPNIPLALISHQTSSLSLNDVNDLNEAESTDAEQRVDCEMKHNDERDEPEAVMVEVEDHIVETASPLVAVLPMVEHQTPVYRYAEVTCSDFCKSRSVQSFESHPNNDTDKIKTLNYINDLWLQLESRNQFNDDNLKYFKAVFSTMRNSFPDFENNLSSVGAKRTFVKVKELVDDLFEITNLLQLEEACCQELIDERQMIFRKKLDDLHTKLNEVRQHIESERNNSRSVVPEINVTADDGVGYGFNASTTLANTAVTIAAALSTTLEASDDLSTTVTEAPDGDTTRKAPNRNYSNGSGKKKLRLRKMGSRQNSKTESDSSDGECANVLETPRRVKRKASSRMKQRSFEDDRKSAEESRGADDGNAGEDIVYVLKVKPGQPIEQQEICQDKNSKMLISGTETCVQLMHTPQTEANSPASKSNIFVKTKRKVFTTVEEPGSTDGLAVIATELIGADTSIKSGTDLEASKEQSKNLPNNIVKPTVSPGIKNMISKLCESMPLEKLASTPTSVNQGKVAASGALRNRNSHIFKSVSAGDIFAGVPVEIQKKSDNILSLKSQSFANLKQGWELHHNAHPSTQPLKTRIPLANDSFRALKKTSSSIPPRGTSSSNVVAEKREHLFRKNRNATSAVKTGGSGKRIETKIAKSAVIVDSSGYPLSPDKSDNTIPKITRKLENKSLTPTNKRTNFDFHDTIVPPSISEPSTPLTESMEKPRTPLSERAIRLQRAKEEFLQGGSMPKINMRHNEASGSQRSKEKWENRQSHQSNGSDISTGGIDDGMLLKSVSVGMLPADSDCSEQQSGDGYDSLPRLVSRSGKLTSKLGFATLASKLRRVKLRRGSKEAVQPIKGSALSALCRQSLFVDLNSIAQQNLMKSQSSVGQQNLMNTHSSVAKQNLMKSQSSQAAIGVKRTNSDTTADADKLNKSKSDNYFPHRKKESCV